MQIRWLKHKNENGQIENFYPITHAEAIIYGEDGEKTFNDINDNIDSAIAKADSAIALVNDLNTEVDELQNALNGKLDSTATATAATTLTGLTTTVAELNYVDGVTSNIQTQLDGKAASSHGTHVTYGTSASALGTFSAGTASTVSRSDHVHALPALTSCTGTLSVAKGGTGATTFTSGAALIGNGTGAVTTRGITDSGSNTAVSGNNLATCDTINYHVAARINRNDSVTSANTSYGTYMARAIAAGTSTPTSLTNGVIYLQY